MKIQELLSRLDKVRPAGKDRWNACCPSHNDVNPSLAITMTDDRILLHCFGGCSAHEVISAAGMELSDLFPKQLGCGNEPVKNPFNHKQLLTALRTEITTLQIIAKDIKTTGKITKEVSERLVQMDNRTSYVLQNL